MRAKRTCNLTTHAIALLGMAATTSLGHAQSQILAGQGFGEPNQNEVKLFMTDGSIELADFLAYGAGSWGAGAVAGEVDGDGEDEILTAPGPGPVLGPHIVYAATEGDGIFKSTDGGATWRSPSLTVVSDGG